MTQVCKAIETIMYAKLVTSSYPRGWAYLIGRMWNSCLETSNLQMLSPWNSPNATVHKQSKFQNLDNSKSLKKAPHNNKTSSFFLTCPSQKEKTEKLGPQGQQFGTPTQCIPLKTIHKTAVMIWGQASLTPYIKP